MSRLSRADRTPAWIQKVIFAVRANFWFWPTLLLMAAIGAAFLSINIDETEITTTITEALKIPPVTVDGARGVLTTIAGSTITIASLVFSLTFVALTLMSQQFGPRILLIFMNDRPTQFVIGIFIAAFIYTLLVLVTIGTGDEDTFVPQLSIYLACIFAVVAFGMVIFFIHHIAESIQADSVVARLGADLVEAINEVLLAHGGSDDRDAPSKATEDIELDDEQSQTLTLDHSGYVQLIDFDEALALMQDHGGRLEYLCRPGHFAMAGHPVIRLQLPDDHDDPDRVAELARETIHVGEKRTQAQQAEYELNALVEVALRALSPGINDPFTAIGCINHITDGLLRLLRGKMRSSVLTDAADVPRVYRHPQSFAHFLNGSFNPLRQSARGNTQVLIHLAECLLVLARAAGLDGQREALREHVEVMTKDCESGVDVKSDRDRIIEDLNLVKEALAQP